MLALVAAVLASAGCDPPVRHPGGAADPDRAMHRPGVSDGRLSVFTVSFPLADFARRIGRDLVEVSFPAPPAVDPAYWSPTPDIIVEYQGADIIVLNGAGYAGWVRHASLPRRALVDSSAGFADALITAHDDVTHHHGPEGEHSHASLAFTTWLDPRLAIEQAGAIAEAAAPNPRCA